VKLFVEDHLDSDLIYFNPQKIKSTTITTITSIAI